MVNEDCTHYTIAMSKLMIANWKSNKNLKETELWFSSFEKKLETLVALDKLHYEVVIAPPMPFIFSVKNSLEKSPLHQSVSLGIQDISAYPAGSYTGAVSGANLENLNVKYAIVGNSERRKYFHETSQDIALKVDQCLENGITPVVCVDRGQIQTQSDLIHSNKREKIVVAYEPIEHIGTGVSQDVSEVLEVIKEIGNSFSGSRIIYGGSVNRDNIAQYLPKSEIEGFLVGSASLDAEHFVDLMSV
jgi:triosephosphate isomerase